MKRNFLLSILVFLLSSWGLFAQNAWINEIHYDNVGTDVDEIVEVAIENASSYNLADFSVQLYNGNNYSMYSDTTLDVFTQGATVGNFTIYYFNYSAAGKSIQNGAPDGLALSYQSTLISGQFLSYEGSFTAADGPAIGVASVDIGVAETTTTPTGQSLQLSGSGSQYNQFTWNSPATATPGQLNNNQTFGGYTPDPEPTNYPTEFSAVAAGTTITVSWTDATGEQLPAGYLIKASTNENISLPVDGTPVIDDLDLSDGNGAKNIYPSTQTFTFEGLASATKYYFKIFPFTNSGQYIDYKSDGSIPSANATTATIVHFQDFEDGLTPWMQYSVTGDQVWVLDSIHGLNGSKCIKMSGYADTTNYPNEDWLISPVLNLGTLNNGNLSFYTAMKYGSGENTLIPMYSTNYSGTGNPNDATWTVLQATLSSGNWTWTYSGNIDISTLNDQNFRLAFKYTSDTDARTWEVDNVQVSGNPQGIGINEPTNLEKGISIYPNPVTTNLYITLPSDTKSNITMYSLVGSPIFKITNQEKTAKINVSELPKGIYFVTIQNIISGKTVTKKVVIR